MNEQDFDKFMAELRAKTPNELDVQNWKAAVRKAVPLCTPATYRMPYMQVTAAVFVGFFIGCFAMYSFDKKHSETNFANNSSENATIEYVITKME